MKKMAMRRETTANTNTNNNSNVAEEADDDIRIKRESDDYERQR